MVDSQPRQQSSKQWLLFLSIFIVATCGLIYELVAGTLASYLLGDSVTQFSTIIGTYLFAMGIGSWLSRYFKGNLLTWFVTIELMVGVVGGSSAAILFLAFNHIQYFGILLYSLVILTGILVGLELPLLMRILQNRIEFSDLVSKMFTFDYIGALFASLLFPLLLVPHLGLMRTAFFFGVANVVIAYLIATRFRNELTRFNRITIAAFGCLILLLLGFIFSEKLTSWAETQAYQDKIILSVSSPYQRIVVTRNSKDTRLFLNGNLQFSSRDEYRYHEALVHPAFCSGPVPKHVLILGGGDGLAAREVLKYQQVEDITLVDLDARLTQLFTNNKLLTKLNNESLKSPKVKVINSDAFIWTRDQSSRYDIIIIDFPDPSNYSLGKLYTTGFYRQISNILTENGVVVVQSTSPYVARKSFWIIDSTIKSAGFQTKPYHCFVPSFGEWGFVLASKSDLQFKNPLPSGLKFLAPSDLPALFEFQQDLGPLPSAVNTLNNQVLVNTFEAEWAEYL